MNKATRPKPVKRPNLVVPQASPLARKTAAAILEVLAGVRTPAEAAQAIEVTVARYYQIELRGLGGLVAACEPRSKGPGNRSQRQIAQLEKEVERLKRERDRHQALARASQRTVGLLNPVRAPIRETNVGGKKKRKRRPVVRALSIASGLRVETAVGDPDAVAVQQPVVTGESSAPNTEAMA